jgi:hypothetical protein
MGLALLVLGFSHTGRNGTGCMALFLMLSHQRLWNKLDRQSLNANDVYKQYLQDLNVRVLLDSVVAFLIFKSKI